MIWATQGTLMQTSLRSWYDLFGDICPDHIDIFADHCWSLVFAHRGHGSSITMGELCSTICTKTQLYVRSGSYIKQKPLEHLSYIKQMPLKHLSYIKKTSRKLRVVHKVERSSPVVSIRCPAFGWQYYFDGGASSAVLIALSTKSSNRSPSEQIRKDRIVSRTVWNILSRVERTKRKWMDEWNRFLKWWVFAPARVLS